MNTITNDSVRKDDTVKDIPATEKNKDSHTVAKVNADGSASVATPEAQRDIAKVNR